MIFWKRKKTVLKENHEYIRWKIKRDCLLFILESAKAVYPQEFAGMLRANKNIITEVVLLPGTIQGDTHAIFNFAMLPIDMTIVGTVHSHPSYSTNASSADLHMFSKHGRVHMIVAMPFNESSWQGYDGQGDPIDIEII